MQLNVLNNLAKAKSLISTTKRQGEGGQRGGQPQENTKKN